MNVRPKSSTVNIQNLQRKYCWFVIKINHPVIYHYKLPVTIALPISWPPIKYIGGFAGLPNKLIVVDEHHTKLHYYSNIPSIYDKHSFLQCDWHLFYIYKIAIIYPVHVFCRLLMFSENLLQRFLRII